MRLSTVLYTAVCLASLTACGSHDSSSPAPASPAPATTTTAGGASANANAAVTYAMIAPIITANCASSGCHGSGSAQTVFVGNQANVDANKAAIASQVTSGVMPLAGSLSAADKANLLNYCNN